MAGSIEKRLASAPPSIVQVGLPVEPKVKTDVWFSDG